MFKIEHTIEINGVDYDCVIYFNRSGGDCEIDCAHANLEGSRVSLPACVFDNDENVNELMINEYEICIRDACGSSFEVNGS